MAYFLKKSNYKKGTYLQIYESFYDPERKGPSLGFSTRFFQS